MQPFKPQFEALASADAGVGHEEGDVAVNGIFVFLALLAASLLFTIVFCYGLRIALNRFVEATNPVPNVWLQRQQAEMAAERARDLHPVPGKPMPNEEMVSQREMEQLAIRFPQPRVQTDDDITELDRLHGQEDQSLNGYRWVDRKAGRVAIPIDQAMQVIAQRGLSGTQTASGAENLHPVPQATTSGMVQTSPELHETEPSFPAPKVE